jgi:hypothetical protein
MSLRAIKAQARRDLHEAMRVPALYLPDWPGDVEDAIPCHVRVHTRFEALGDMTGTSLGYAEVTEQTPKLIFWREELNPSQGGVVSVELGEAYRIQSIDPKDGLTITALVSPMSAAQSIGLPVPEVE